jgi:membrane-associated phospholipid phosphatase
MSTEWNLTLQKWESLAPVMKVLTFLGNEEFFLLLLPLVYLCVDARLGLRLGALVLGSDILNNLLKVLFAMPRPYWADNRVQALMQDTSYGMPSSHAQNAAAVWPYLALMSRRAWMWIVAGVLVLGIGISRMAVGVHYMGDVVVGWAIGAVVLVLFLALIPKLENWYRSQSLVNQIFVASAIVLIVLALRFAIDVLRPVEQNVAWAQMIAKAQTWDAIAARTGALWGLLVGGALMLRSARFATEGSIGQRVARFCVALIGVAVCWKGLSAVFPREPEIVGLMFRFVRYALLTLWVTWGAPVLFLKLNWLRSRPLQSTLNAA